MSNKDHDLTPVPDVWPGRRAAFGASVLIGLIVAMFQAATQINEQTLSFLPRLLITFLTLIWLGPWLATQMVEFTDTLYRQIPGLIG